ncbi:MAG: hypothetical protein DMF80_00765 [Acidobacteria bacterium]|nr:MAG: hypothetical protein DMF80_00765 [Acidobacteriota bacterium]
MRLHRGGRLRWPTIGLAAVVGIGVLWHGRAAPALPTAEVKTGELVDFVELRGEVKAVKSVTLNAPSSTDGDLQIISILKNGTGVKTGENVVQLDTVKLQRTREQQQSDLKRAEAEIEGAQAQARLQEEQNRTELMQARYDVERARLDVQKQEILSAIEAGKTKLRLATAEQRAREAEQKLRAGRAAAAADIESKKQKRAKALFEVQRAQRGIESMTLKAPVDGMVTILPNWRGRFFGANAPEFKEGDRVWPGAPLVELPDLSAVRVAARVDEAERGQLSLGQTAVVRVDAVPDKEFTGTVSDISALAKIDFSTWPPPKNFDLALRVAQSDPRLRPGMSATARVAIDRVPGALLIPVAASFQKGGRTVSYVLRGARFEERTIEIARRNREQIAVARGLRAGEKVALRDPTEEASRR